MGRPKQTQARGNGLGKDGDEYTTSQESYDQPRFHAPKGYKDSVWMLASLFDSAAKYHGQSTGRALPIIHGTIDEATHRDQGKTGWPFLVAQTFTIYWRRVALSKPSGLSFDQHWAEVYEELRDLTEDRVDGQALARLEAKRERMREQVESGEIDIVRRMM